MHFAVEKVQSLRRVENINEIYEIGNIIGNGSYGQVVQARHIKLGLPCAVKVIPKEKMSTSKMRKDRMINELKILEKTCHQSIARVYELLHDRQNFYIVSELVKSGDMAKLMSTRAKQNRGLLNERDVKFIARQLFGAINYLHR